MTVPAGTTSSEVRVLVVDDNDDAAQATAIYLMMQGFKTLVANSARETIERVRSWKPDVVLLDLGLPMMDGFAVAATIRAEHGTAAPLLIAVTGYSDEKTRLRVEADRLDGYFLKPTDPDALAAYIRTKLADA